MGKSSRTIGHDFERKVAKDLRAYFPDAKRGYQARGGTSAAPDVDGTPFYIECKKNGPAASPAAALLQASEGSDGRPAVAVVRESRKAIQVAMFLSVAHDLFQNSVAVPNRQPRGPMVLVDYSSFLGACASLAPDGSYKGRSGITEGVEADLDGVAVLGSHVSRQPTEAEEHSVEKADQVGDRVRASVMTLQQTGGAVRRNVLRREDTKEEIVVTK